MILLMVVGVIILVTGIGAANIYGQPPYPKEARDAVAQSFYQRNYDELSDYGKAQVDSWLAPPLSMQEKNAQFARWLVKPLKWIGIGFGIFLILTAALVVSRVILDKTRPPSSSS